MGITSQLDKATIDLVEAIRREEDQQKDYERLLREMERGDDGLFHFYCPICDEEFTTKNYNQNCCSDLCDRIAREEL